MVVSKWKPFDVLIYLLPQRNWGLVFNFQMSVYSGWLQCVLAPIANANQYAKLCIHLNYLAQLGGNGRCLGLGGFGHGYNGK